MSRYIYGYLMPQNTNGNRDNHLRLSKIMEQCAKDNDLFIHLGFGIPARSVLGDIFSQPEVKDVYDSMPFLFTEASFDGASDERIDAKSFMGEYSDYSYLREKILGFVLCLKSHDINGLTIAFDSGYQSDKGPLFVSNIQQIDACLSLLLPDHHEIESGYIHIDLNNK